MLLHRFWCYLIVPARSAAHQQRVRLLEEQTLSSVDPCCTLALCLLQVLWQHQDALLTVVQVVLHDPLYRWQMTPVKAGRKQQDPMAQQQADADAAGGGDGSAAAAAAGTGTAAAAAAAGVSSGALGNADAERAVLRVKQKLQGQDVEGGAALSVEAQVAAMLQAARDPERLCRMFKGWAAWV
jgi:ataxia telangiectasia mutated family protein